MFISKLKTSICTLRITIAFLLVMFFAPVAMSQSDQITIDVELSRASVYLGDEVTYQIIVRGSDNPTNPVVSFPDSLNAQYHGRTWQSFTSMRVINGRNSTVTEKRFSFQFTLRAIESGTISIPAPTIEIDGQVYTGQNSSFESILPVESIDDVIEVSLERDEIYLNETVILECAWWIPDQTSEFSFTSSAIPSSFQLFGLEPLQAGTQRIAFDINGQQMLATILDDQLNGVRMTKFVFRMSITPTEQGEFTIGPLRSVFTRQGGSRNAHRAYAQSNTIKVSVRPVPTENQPDGYSGAIGEFQLQTQALNTNVNVGDPIELTLRVRGQEPMVGVTDAPNLSSNPLFVDQFKISSEGWREKLPRQSGQRVYSTTIRALDEHVTQIPSIELPSFNPMTRGYKVYRSLPIDIIVNPVQEVTLSDAVVTGGTPQVPTEKAIERVELTRAMPGLWAHGSLEELQTNSGFSLIETINNPVQFSILASGPCLFAFSLIFAIRRSRRTPQSHILNRAYRHAQSTTRGGHFADGLRHYVSIASGINTDAMTAQDVFLLPIQDADARLIASSLNDAERVEYVLENTSAQSPVDPRQDSRTYDTQLLKRVHLQILNAARANQ